jgi:hypothetical protein
VLVELDGLCDDPIFAAGQRLLCRRSQTNGSILAPETLEIIDADLEIGNTNGLVGSGPSLPTSAFPVLTLVASATTRVTAYITFAE